MKLIDLDECVLNALQLFQEVKLPQIKIDFKRPLVVGSGNAANTGRILFKDKDALFADENNFKEKAKFADGCVLISASGGKHAPIMAKYLSKKMDVILLTCNPDALAKEYAEKTYLFPRRTEPYTYNTSTYLGMIFGSEKSSSIISQIKKIRKKDLKRFTAYTIIIPPEFHLLKNMFQTKFDELFGPKIVGRIFTSEEMKHAKTIVSSEQELFISLGYDNKLWGSKRWNISISNPSYPLLFAVGYFVIGKIQKSNPPWFKKNIAEYCRKTSKLFGHDIEPIVKGFD